MGLTKLDTRAVSHPHSPDKRGKFVNNFGGAITL